MPARLVKFDLIDLLSPRIPKAASHVLVATVCALLAVLSRALVDMFLPGAGPFALTFPFVLFATLFARWAAGVGVMCFSAAYAWYAVLPIQGSFLFENPADGSRVVVNILSGFVIVALAEYFRRVVRRTLQERDDIAEERRLLLEELDHRVKNNFAMVSAMIRLELKSTKDGDTASTLRTVGGRVESIARAHEALYRGDRGVSSVPMRAYLGTLCDSLDKAYFAGRDVIELEACDVALLRDRAIAIGLVVNELCTNAAKHAFRDHHDPRLVVRLIKSGDGITLSVSDNGSGFADGPVRKGSLGQGLLEAFSEQAGGTLERVDVPVGTEFRVVLPG